MNNKYTEKQADLYSFNLKRVIRSAALDSLVLKEAIFGESNSVRAEFQVHIIEMHYLFPEEVSNFRRLLKSLLERGYKFISYTEAVSRIESGNIDSSYMAFTFDDGYRNCLNAARVLEEFGGVGCFFLNSTVVGETNYSLIQKHCSLKLNKPPVEFMNWAEVEDLLSRGHEMGGHTASHLNLAVLNRSELYSEIRQDKEFFDARLGEVIHFAWPYGRMADFSEEARDVVYESGYKSCASAIRGSHTTENSGQQICIHRDHIIAAWPVRQSLYLLRRSASINHSVGVWGF